MVQSCCKLNIAGDRHLNRNPKCYQHPSSPPGKPFQALPHPHFSDVLVFYTYHFCRLISPRPTVGPPQWAVCICHVLSKPCSRLDGMPPPRSRGSYQVPPAPHSAMLLQGHPCQCPLAPLENGLK